MLNSFIDFRMPCWITEQGYHVVYMNVTVLTHNCRMHEYKSCPHVCIYHCRNFTPFYYTSIVSGICSYVVVHIK